MTQTFPATPTKFGRYHAPEPFRLAWWHRHRQGMPLAEVDHEPPAPVLDQEDLIAQGIHASELVPGAHDVDALGSCTCNAAAVSLIERTVAAGRALPAFGQVRLSQYDATVNEEFAIVLYNKVTDQTGDPSSEWPPTDCGSTGLYVCKELQSLGFISRFLSAHDPLSAASLLQSGTVIMGSPWFNSWMEPDSDGFVDGDGSEDAIHDAAQSGLAGGHETCLTALEHLELDALGRPDLERSWFRARNSWSSRWGSGGSFRIHLSTLAAFAQQVDYKQFVL